MRRNGTVVDRRRSVRMWRFLVATGLAALVVAVPVVGAYAEVPATGVTLTGRVVGPDGAAVRGASVTPQLAGGGSLPAVVTAADGTYALPNLVPASYALFVGARPDTGLMSGYYPDGGVPETPQTITISTGPVQQVPDTRLQRGATVSGTVTRPDGTPVRNAAVWVENVSPAGYGGTGNTDENGDYRVTGVRAGGVTVLASSTLSAESWGSDYSGVSTYYAGATGTPRYSLATVCPRRWASPWRTSTSRCPPGLRGSGGCDVLVAQHAGQRPSGDRHGRRLRSVGHPDRHRRVLRQRPVRGRRAERAGAGDVHVHARRRRRVLRGGRPVHRQRHLRRGRWGDIEFQPGEPAASPHRRGASPRRRSARSAVPR